MKPDNDKKFDELIAKAIAGRQTKPDFDTWLENNPSSAKKLKTTSANEPSVWRIIMKNRMTKLTTAAAVILIVLFGLTILDKSVAPAYGISEAFELIRQAKTLHVKGWLLSNHYQKDFETEITAVLLISVIKPQNCALKIYFFTIPSPLCIPAHISLILSLHFNAFEV